MRAKKYFGTAVNLICFSLILATHAGAYLDPSVMTYTVQVVAGVVVAVGAVAGIAWRRAKKKVQDKLGIDENAKKEVEADIIEYDEEKMK